MADIRINSLPTTASASSSNDFLAIDGATNGTRKLSAYSPTFGGAVTINGNGTYGAIQLPSGTTSIYGVAFGTDTNLWRTDSGNLELGGSSVALIGLNVGGTNKGYFYNNGTDTTLAGAGTLTLKSNGTTTGLTLDSSNAAVAGNLRVRNALGYATGIHTGTTSDSTQQLLLSSNAAYNHAYISKGSTTLGIGFSSDNGSFVADDSITITAATKLVTLTGNLTVSGGQALISHSGSYANIYFAVTGSSYSEIRAFSSTGEFRTNSGPSAGWGGFLTWQTDASEKMRLTNSGNLLIGTTTDGGQKLQVSGTAAISGQIRGANIVASNLGSADAGFYGTAGADAGSGHRLALVRTDTPTGGSALLSAFGAAVVEVNATTGLNTGTRALTIDTSANATFAGGIIGMTQGNVDNISDDGVASFTPLYNRGFIVINNPDYSQNALIAYFKAGSSYLLYSITKSADVTLNNSTTLTGTTGTDGKLNIGYNNSIIYIENRLGGIGNFQRYALGGTN